LTDEEKVEIYSPTIRKEKVLNIEGANYKSKLDSIMNKEGFIKTKLNEEVIIQAVSHKLYKNPESALRELYNNSCYHGYVNEKSYVKVSLDTFTRKLIIQDFNCKGITEETFVKILVVLGNTSNKDREKGGKFGLGFASYPLLSDVMKLETNCINGDCYAVLAKGGLGFQKLPKPKLEKTGTKLSMTVREDTNYDKLVQTLKDLAKTSGVKTYFELSSKNNICGITSGLHVLESKSYKEIFEDMNHDNGSYLTSSVYNDEYEIHLSISVDSNGNLENERQKKFYLINSPIQAELDEEDTRQRYYDADHDELDQEVIDKLEKQYNDYKKSRIDEIRFTSLVVNMKNEDTFEAMQDRERSTKNTEKKLREIILNLYNETIKKIKPCHTLDSWFKHEHKFFISSDHPDIVQLLDEKSKPVQKFLNTLVHVYPEKNKYEEKYLKNIIEKNDKYFYVLKKDQRVVNLLDDNFDHFLCVVHPEKDPFDNKDKPTLFNDTIKTLKYFGFVEAKQYLKDNNIKTKRSLTSIDKVKGDITVHKARSYSDYWSSGIRSSSETFNLESKGFEDIKEFIIQVNPFQTYRDILKEIKSDYYLTTEKKEVKGIVKTIDDIYAILKEKTFSTNHGNFTIEQIIESSKEIALNSNFDLDGKNEDYKEKSLQNYNEQLKALPYISKSKLYLVSSSLNELFLVALILKKYDKKYNWISESIENYYHNKLKELEKNLKTINQEVDSDQFGDMFEYEKYLNALRDFELKVTDPVIRKFVKLSHNEKSYQQIIKDAMELNARTQQFEKQKIERKKEYL